MGARGAALVRPNYVARFGYLLPFVASGPKGFRRWICAAKAGIDRLGRSPTVPIPEEGMTANGARRQFLADYARIRAAEERGADTSAYYRALPFTDLTGRNSGQWRIRERTFEYFLRHVLPRR